MCMQGSYVRWCVFLVFLQTFTLKVLRFSRHRHRSISSGLIEENDRNHSQSCSQAPMKTGLDLITRTEDSVSSNTSKCQFVSRESIGGYIKEPDTASFFVREMFVDRTQNLLDDTEHVFQFKFPLNFDTSAANSGVEVMDHEGNGLLQDRDCSYEVESNPVITTSHVSASDASSQVLDHREVCRDIAEDDRIRPEEYMDLEQREILLHDEETSRKESQLGNKIWWDANDFDDDEEDDDDDETDVLREHQSLVQQMKMELKNCRVKGLPTISEEHESPKMLEDLKRFEAELKFEYKDAIEEIRAFYKIYVEKMRKLDVLNYQTLQAMSFREMKDKEELAPHNKKTGSTYSLLTRMRTFDARKVYADPSQRSISELNRDLESIYVGQLCLSWEILAWSYVKARELLRYDSKGNHSYNRVSEEFQQFQVLLQRFVEDEPFQGEERTTSYAKRRCAIRNLLQVPMIRDDDCFKDRKERTEETDAISLEILLDVIRESMMVFRDFLYADKRAINDLLRGVKESKLDNNKESSDSRLLADVIETLYKKDKRIKESIRSQSCTIKKLKRQHRSENEAFKSQVDLRLVSRVLSLPKLTRDQMLWCQMKLNNIGFVGTKVVHVEPSFLLLPC